MNNPEEIQLFIQTDGSFLIPVDKPEHRKFIIDAFKDLVSDPDQLLHFVEINDSELLFGDSLMCG